jgi:transposase-like protein
MGRPEFPKTLREFRRQFSTDAACQAYLAQSRWQDGFVCPHCGGRKCWEIKEPFGYECSQCGRRTSPTAGTAMHRSHVGIQEWFWAAYLVATHTPGFSAKQLERQIGCAYRTAWFMLHRLRRAMVSYARSRLEGDIEADETIGRFLMQNVGPGSMVRTDGWKGYSTTALANYRHTQSPGARATHIHRAFGNLKTWLNGTHHGVGPKYLQTYLDESVFRFNRRKTAMAAFQTLLGIATCKSPQTLANLKHP